MSSRLQPYYIPLYRVALFLFLSFTTAQTFNCGPQERIDFLSDHDYANADVELTPKGAIEESAWIICNQFVIDPTENAWHFATQVTQDTQLLMRLYKPADSDFTVECTDVFFQLREQCFDGKMDGRNYASGTADLNGIQFSATFGHMSEPSFPGGLLGGDADDDDTGNGDDDDPKGTQPPYTFAVYDFFGDYPGPRMTRESGVLVGGQHITCEDAAASTNAWVFLDSITGGSLQDVPYRDQIPDWDSFKLKGWTNKLCGLPMELWFSQENNNLEGRFAWTENNKDGPITGYCDLEPDPQVTKCSQPIGEDISFAKVMQCFAMHSKNYCENFGEN